MIKKIRITVIRLISVLTLFCCLSGVVFGIEPVRTDAECTMTVRFVCEKERIEGINVSVYLVGSISEEGTPAWSGEIAAYGLPINNAGVSSWDITAANLRDYLAHDRVPPLRTGKTDQNGEAFFEGLLPGLYLVACENMTVGEYRYSSKPALVTLPTSFDKGESWTYDVSVEPKTERIRIPEEPVNRKVLKVWQDDGVIDRPRFVTVTLLRNGQPFETVTLNEGNGWRHTWEDLEAAAEWTLIENDVPEGYSVSISREGITFVVTNRYIPDNPPPPPDDPPPPLDNPPPEEELPPDEPPPLAPPEPFLPQTGLLWWPVPLFGVIGLSLIAVGILLQRKERGDEEA